MTSEFSHSGNVNYQAMKFLRLIILFLTCCSTTMFSSSSTYVLLEFCNLLCSTFHQVTKTKAADFDGFWRTDEREDNPPGALPEHSGRWIVRTTVMAFTHWRGFNFFDLVSSDADSGEVRQALNVSVTPTFLWVVYLHIDIVCCTNITMFLV